MTHKTLGIDIHRTTYQELHSRPRYLVDTEKYRVIQKLVRRFLVGNKAAVFHERKQTPVAKFSSDDVSAMLRSAAWFDLYAKTHQAA